MNPFQSVLLGFIQGLTEFLPVSSSGHLVIAQIIFQLAAPPILFDIIVHTATLLAVLIFFRKDILRLKSKLILLIVLATIPTGIIGLILNSYKQALFSSLLVVSFGLLITSVLLLMSFFKFKTKQLASALPSSYQALIIGLMQGLAIIPGISRSGATISTALILGLSAKVAFTFSFLISIPAILAALFLQLLESPTSTVSISPLVNILGFLVALLTGSIALTFLRNSLKSKRFHLFSLYTFILAVVAPLLVSILK